MSDLDTLIESLRKKHSEDMVFMTDNLPDLAVEAIPSGSMSFDIASGIGGVPRSRITELFGVESSGKTTLCQHILANAQKAGLNCAYIDTEHAIDFDYMQVCGVDVSKVLFSQPDTFEGALDLVEDLINSGEIQLILFDSLVGIAPEKEIEDELKAANVALISKLLTKFFRRNIHNIKKNNVALVVTNQARDIIGAYVPMVGTAGGHAIKHYASLRVQTYKGKDIKTATEIVGSEFRAVFRKNKVGRPSQTAYYSIYYGYGIDRVFDILNVALEYGILKKRGSYIVYEGETLAQGKVKTLDFLKHSPEVLKQIEKELRETI